jgi:hypothetical protein
MIYQPWPNKSPKPTTVGAGSSAVAVHAARKAWLMLSTLGNFIFAFFAFFPRHIPVTDSSQGCNLIEIV